MGFLIQLISIQVSIKDFLDKAAFRYCPSSGEIKLDQECFYKWMNSIII